MQIHPSKWFWIRFGLRSSFHTETWGQAGTLEPIRDSDPIKSIAIYNGSIMISRSLIFGVSIEIPKEHKCPGKNPVEGYCEYSTLFLAKIIHSDCIHKVTLANPARIYTRYPGKWTSPESTPTIRMYTAKTGLKRLNLTWRTRNYGV